MKSSSEYFPVVLFNMLYKVVLTLECVDEIRKCEHSGTQQYFGSLFVMLYDASKYKIWYGRFSFLCTSQWAL